MSLREFRCISIDENIKYINIINAKLSLLCLNMNNNPYQKLCSMILLDRCHRLTGSSGVGTFLMDSPSRSSCLLHRSDLGCRRKWWAVVHPGPQGNNNQQNSLHSAGPVHNPGSIYQQCRVDTVSH